MKFTTALGFIVINLLRRQSNCLTLKTVEAWVIEHSDMDRYGMGYSGNRLSSGSGNGFIEITKRPQNSGFLITASIYRNPRQASAASKAWTVAKIDSELEKYFGKDMRIRINI